MIGIFSDIHGHTAALEKTLKLLKREGAEHLYCLGDIIGYVPDASAISIVQDSARISLRGNHEHMLHVPPEDPRKADIYRIQKIQESITKEEKSYLLNLPLSHNEQFACGRALFIHGNPTDPLNGYIYPDTDLEPWSDVAADFIFMGHTHYPFMRKLGDKVFVNVGSCGLPRDDGALGAAALFDEKIGTIKIIRFSIEAETYEIKNKAFLIHDSVRDIYDRRSKTYIGELIDG